MRYHWAQNIQNRKITQMVYNSAERGLSV